MSLKIYLFVYSRQNLILERRLGIALAWIKFKPKKIRRSIFALIKADLNFTTGAYMKYVTE